MSANLAVNCGQLSDPENGKVTLTGTDVFSMATYNCNQGFGLLGVSSRICQDSGSWSDSAPTCERKELFVCYCCCYCMLLPACLHVVVKA